MPFVSVILATYNWKTEWLSKSIESVLTQSYTNFELIIVNDCSTNDIEETINNYIKKDKRIIYIKNDKNLKLTKSLNIWIDNSKGDYIARIDDDDIWSDKDKLYKQVKFMENNNNSWVCWTQIKVIDSMWNFLYDVNKEQADIDIRNKILFWSPFYHSSVMIRKKAIDEFWKYSEKWNYIEDYELWLRIWKKYKFNNLKDNCIYYRQSNTSISFTNTLKQRILWIKVCLKYKKYYPKFYRAFLYHIIRYLISIFAIFLKNIKLYNYVLHFIKTKINRDF